MPWLETFFSRFVGPDLQRVLARPSIRVLVGSTTGTATQVAAELRLPRSQVTRLQDYEIDHLPTEDVVVFLLSTAHGGAPPESCAFWCNLLEEYTTDFRVGKEWLATTRFAVLGFGSMEYKEHFCTCAVALDRNLQALGAKRLVSLHCCTDTLDLEPQVGAWRRQLDFSLDARTVHGDDDGDAASEAATEASEADLEDQGPVDPEKSMLTKRQRSQLEKEGYKLIGSHSAVKLCRWTKHHLRGRGGCYKHTFYGITSYQCMEATPSLACANKCVFCWRHHKNPVGTSWQWKQDEPAAIVDGAIQQHVRMIKEARGIPGVQPWRFEEALTVRHCALSLVGEPIMYPRINEMLGLMHGKQISTFMVTNAQFPAEIKRLVPVTQLYVSVDAASKDELKAIDRPLHQDFWERFQDSLKALKAKKQRTVYRLTLVSAMNMSSAKDYADLVQLGEPDFIEIKAVTFCGDSKGSNLTMRNVPWHDDVRAFALSILAARPDVAGSYGFACEHRHSCCVLLAHRKFSIGGKWHTWIDYPKFHALVASGQPFDSADYMAETPSWAVAGAAEEGFDPLDTRVQKTRKHKPGTQRP